MILRLLRDGPLTSGEIADRFDSSWPTISRHLAVLREAGLVVTERHGQEIRYELNASVFQDLVQHLIDWTRPSREVSRRLSKPARARHQEV
jgi:DNA-binding transcriptional ArsR family regulator